MDRGYVYVLMNSAIPDLVKIGQTTRSPEQRARELSAETGVPVPYVVAYDAELLYFVEAEREIHQRLERFRVNQRREFFRMPLKEAILVVWEVSWKYHQIEQEEIARAEAARGWPEVEVVETELPRDQSVVRHGEGAAPGAQQAQPEVEEEYDPAADTPATPYEHEGRRDLMKSPGVFVVIFLCVAAAMLLSCCCFSVFSYAVH